MRAMAACVSCRPTTWRLPASRQGRRRRPAPVRRRPLPRRAQSRRRQPTGDLRRRPGQRPVAFRRTALGGRHRAARMLSRPAGASSSWPTRTATSCGCSPAIRRAARWARRCKASRWGHRAICASWRCRDLALGHPPIRRWAGGSALSGHPHYGPDPKPALAPRPTGMELPPTYGKSCRANNARGVIRRCPEEPADNRKRLFALRNQDPPRRGLSCLPSRRWGS